MKYLRYQTHQLIALILRVVLWIRTRRHPAPMESEPEPVAPAPVTLPAPRLAWHPRRPRRSRAVDPQNEDFRWHFRSVILERLEEYFICFKRLKQYDLQAYRTFAKLGLAIPPDLYFNPENVEFDPLGKNLPTFGGILFPQIPPEKDIAIVPSFFYFRKLRSAGATVQFWHGDVYSLTMLYDDRDLANHWASKLAAPVNCHIGINQGDGSTHLLRELFSIDSKIYPGRKHPRGRQPSAITVTNRFWAYPDWILQMAEEHHTTPDDWASGMLRMALGTYVETLDRIVIRVKKDHTTAAFGIELPRAKHFFKDRDATALARDGKRKRIFHSVREHERLIRQGEKVIKVTSHYRGLRVFDWNSYFVRIVLPANASALGFDSPAYYAADAHPTALEPEATVADQVAGVLDR